MTSCFESYVVTQSLDILVSNAHNMVTGQQIVSVIRPSSFIYGPIAGLAAI
jgi:hypothetical protein